MTKTKNISLSSSFSLTIVDHDRSDNNKNDKDNKEQQQQQQRYCCPICINDIKIGEQIVTCCYSTSELGNERNDDGNHQYRYNNNHHHYRHYFHLDCLVDWLCTGSTICPYCRRTILTRNMIQTEIAKRKNSREANINMNDK